MGCHLKGLKRNVKTIASFWTYCNYLLLYLSCCDSIRLISWRHRNRLKTKKNFDCHIPFSWNTFLLSLKHCNDLKKYMDNWRCFTCLHQMKFLMECLHFFVASQRIRLMNRFILSKSCEQYGFTAGNFCSIILTYIQFKRIVVSMLFFVSYNH